MDDELVQVQLSIRGHVQGVFFRATTRDVATRHGVAGWIRNEPDGTVTAVLRGPRPAVDEVVDFARQGPLRARVDHVDVTEQEPTGTVPETFQTR